MFSLLSFYKNKIQPDTDQCTVGLYSKLNKTFWEDELHVVSYNLQILNCNETKNHFCTEIYGLADSPIVISLWFLLYIN